MTNAEVSLSRRQVRILVVDDSSLIRLYCRDVLEKAGYKVEHAINGIEAMEKVLGSEFHMLIVDVNMPTMDGLSFLRALRKGGQHASSTPVLMMTTEAGKQDREDARAAGANFYLVKPVTELELLRHVAALTGSPA